MTEKKMIEVIKEAEKYIRYDILRNHELTKAANDLASAWCRVQGHRPPAWDYEDVQVKMNGLIKALGLEILPMGNNQFRLSRILTAEDWGRAMSFTVDLAKD